jgi:CheY-like chemotaxis protein
MMELADLKAACGLIAAGTAKGTGYLIDSERVATCAHVVQGAGEGGTISVDFHGEVRDASVLKVDRANDCAILQLHQPLSGVTPLRLNARCRWKAPWDGYGYPAVAKGAGIPLEGAVRDPAARDDLGAPVLILASPEVAAGMAAPIHGFSGSPVVVEGAVVGHLKRIIPDPGMDPTGSGRNPRPAFGYVYATPSNAVLTLMGMSPEEHDPVITHLKKIAHERNQDADLPTAIDNLDMVKAVRRARVLWVDDHPDYNIDEHLMLRDLGMYITATTSSKAARRYLDTGAFDLLITDLTRGWNRNAGLTLIKKLRDAKNYIPAVIYTMDPGERATRAAALGVATVTTPSALLTAVLKVVSEDRGADPKNDEGH